MATFYLYWVLYGVYEIKSCQLQVMEEMNQSKPIKGDDDGFQIHYVILVDNLIEIVLITRKSGREKAYETILISLSTSDFLFGLVNISLSLNFLLTDDEKKSVNVNFTVYFYWPNKVHWNRCVTNF